MRVVLDTNVFVSGVYFSGPPSRVLEAWRDGVIELVVSAEILEEYVRVGEELASSFGVADLEPVLDLVAVSATLVRAAPLQGPACRDPDDDKFLACALAARAEYIVSGDRHLLEVSPYRGVSVFRPRAFVEAVLA